MLMLPATQAEHLPAAALTPLYHVTYLQGFAVFIDLRLVKPNLSKEERNQVLLQDLAVDSYRSVYDAVYSAPLSRFPRRRVLSGCPG
jgi:hypothetical protein